MDNNNMDNCGCEHGTAASTPGPEDKEKLSEEIMELLSKRTANPSEAFVMMQQMCVLLWEQYKIDWKNQTDHNFADSRKQRYLDFVSSLIDNLLANMKAE